MVITVGILVLFLMAIMNGYRSGLVKTLFRFVGRIIIWVVAVMLSHNIGQFLADNLQWSIGSNWSSPVTDNLVDKSSSFLYSGIGFTIITVIGFYLLHRLQSGLAFINKVPLVGTANRLAGALLSFIIMYLGVFFFLYIAGALDISLLHEQITYSTLAQIIMQQTPILSEKIYEWFLLI
ncbi:membrane ancor connecting MutS2 with cell-division Z-ring [Weissella koreensis KACC 15510]|uniref:CvpA family protein n=1 Tax=Weissella koreensis TaxID=165096 RepID=UPI0002175228|nr:CvpA family protein [Weissella koreensis]AEJ24009.1 membrane ancor connecting MutS2 with cell-division Z-ring [Weissella koreensis KACC 15510]